MAHTARRVVVEYRIPKKDFAAAVAYYADLLLGKRPEPVPDDQLLIEVFKVPQGEEYFQCELCLTCVPDTVEPGPPKPLVFWGSDEPGELAEETVGEPAENTPREVGQVGPRRGFNDRQAGVADAFGNRVGFITNPDYP